jgi:hypothetical protein
MYQWSNSFYINNYLIVSMELLSDVLLHDEITLSNFSIKLYFTLLHGILSKLVKLVFYIEIL